MLDKISATLLFATAISVVQAIDNGLGLSPAMGWNTWNTYACNIDESIILNAAMSLKNQSLDTLGYTYVNIDDCWQAPNRTAAGDPVEDPTKFPSGMKNLTDQIHAMGLKVGIYSDAGKYTCGGKFGSLGFETQDATAYASWGIDYLKYDNCYNEGQSGTPQISQARYATMGNALNATGRPILYSLCSWGDDWVWNWGSTTANSWRISGDIYDNFDRYDDRCPCQTSSEICPLAGYHCSIMNIVEKAAGLGQKAQMGAWNDLDGLEVGNGEMTYDEYVSHFSLWALAKSPLLLGNDITNMTNETLSIITNKDIIALSQDTTYNAGYRIWKQTNTTGGSTQLWKSNLVNSTYALLLLNATPNNSSVSAALSDFFIDEGKTMSSKSWNAYDLWNNATLAATIPGGGNLTVDVPTHGVRVFRLSENNATMTRRHLEL